MDNTKLIILIFLFILILLILFPNINNDMKKNTDNNPIVEFETNLGNFKLEIYLNTMPVTSNNFLKLVKEEFYNNTIIHRVIDNFMIQGGDPTGTGFGGPGYKIMDEFTKSNRNDIGTISMANSGPNSGGSQFFINVNNNNYLDTKHPVFGKVIEGYEIVEKISKVNTDENDKPLEDIIIISIKLI